MSRRDTDDDAPWLAEAELSPRRGQGRETTRVSRRSLFWTLFIGLVLVAVAGVGVMVLVARKDGGSTQGYMNAENAPLIAAETGPYKVEPSDPKGLEVAGQDQTLYATGEGADQGSVIDQSAVPETPMARPTAQGAGAAPPATVAANPPGAPRNLLPEAHRTTPVAPDPAPPAPIAPRDGDTGKVIIKPDVKKPEVRKPDAAKPANADTVKAEVAKAAKPVRPDAVSPTPPVVKASPKPNAKPETKPETRPSGTAHTVQLGAFSSPEKAEAAWNALAGRGMMGFNHRLIKIEKGDTTLYRLRASGGDAAALCAKLKSAGDACSVVE